MGLAGLLRWTADRMDPPAKPSTKPTPVRTIARPAEGLFTRDAERAAARREDATSLLDDECLSYVIVQARGDLEGPVEVTVNMGVDDFAWAALSHTLAQIVVVADSVHGP